MWSDLDNKQRLDFIVDFFEKKVESYGNTRTLFLEDPHKYEYQQGIHSVLVALNALQRDWK